MVSGTSRRVEDNRRTRTQQEQKKKKKRSRDEYCSKAKAVRSFRNLAPKFSISTIEMIMVGDDDRCEILVNRGRGSTEEGDYGILKRCVWEGRFQPRVLCAAIRFIH